MSVFQCTSNIMIGSTQPKVLAEFYEKVFGKPADWSDGNWYGWQAGRAFLTIGEHSEVKGKAREPQRVILNFETSEVKQEFERPKNLGAEVIKEPYEMEGGWIATFADPDGNYFQFPLLGKWRLNSRTSLLHIIERQIQERCFYRGVRSSISQA